MALKTILTSKLSSTPMNPFIEIKKTVHKGRGVFARKNFAPGELIEAVPLIIFPTSDKKAADQTILYSYLFNWNDSYALALGNGSLFNHSYTPNAVYARDYSAEIISFSALTPILAGEEITINYNGRPDCQDPFDDFEVK